MSRETALQSPERKRRAKQPPPRAIFSIGDYRLYRANPVFGILDLSGPGFGGVRCLKKKIRHFPSSTKTPIWALLAARVYDFGRAFGWRAGPLPSPSLAVIL